MITPETHPAMPYQVIGAKFLSERPKALLADDMGLGKTLQAILACDILRATRILIFCPAVGRFNWKDEFEKWQMQERTIQPLVTGKDVVAPGHNVVICTYDLATTHYDMLKALRWDVVIADESHYLKTRDSQRTKTVLGTAGRGGFAPLTDHLWLLSGTPAPNNFGELYPMMRAFGIWQQDYWEFLTMFTVWYDTPFGIQIKKGRHQGLLKEMLMPIMLRRKKEDVLKDLPELFFQHQSIEPGEVDDEIWFPSSQTGRKDPELPARLESERKFLDELTSRLNIGVGQNLAAIETSKAATATIRRWNGQSKVQPVAELAIDALTSGAIDKLVIFGVHRNVIMDLEMRLKKFKPVTLFGGTPPNKKATNVRKFQNDPKVRVFLGNIQAAGTSITLTAAQHVWFIEQSWVPSENAQAVMRLHRIGQQRTVFAKFFGVAGSIDDRIAKVVKDKTKELAQLF